MNYFVKNKAQGTIEYLIIIAVVVVISLALVTILLTQGETAQKIGADSNKTQGIIGKGGISITDSMTSSSGDSVISLKNNSGSTLTVTKLTPIDDQGNAGISKDYNNDLLPGYELPFIVTDINSVCPCTIGKTTTCKIKITFTSSSGLEQNETLIITNTCTETITDTNTVIQPLECVHDSNCDAEEMCKNNICVPKEYGTETYPFVINDCLELQAMNQDLDANYILGNDIDCLNTKNWNCVGEVCRGFEPIGTDYENPFYGKLTGNYHLIKNLYINRPSTDYVGLFGYAQGEESSNIELTKIGLTDVNIIGNNGVGGLVGGGAFIYLNQDYVTGQLKGNRHVGGLAGNFDGEINNSYSLADVNSNYAKIGGLAAGSDYISINNSYSAGNVFCEFPEEGEPIVEPFDVIGGLVGEKHYVMVTNSYYNSDTSLQFNGDSTEKHCGLPKTTIEMTTTPNPENIYTDWDFSNIWKQESGNYPTLKNYE